MGSLPDMPSFLPTIRPGQGRDCFWKICSCGSRFAAVASGRRCWLRSRALPSTSTVTAYTGKCSAGTRRRSLCTRSWERRSATSGGRCCLPMKRCGGWRRRRGEKKQGEERYSNWPSALFCDPGCLGQMAGEESSRLRGLVVTAGQERRGPAVGHLRGGPGSGFVLRMDRRAKARRERSGLAATVPRALTEQRVVEDQSRESGCPDRIRSNESRGI